MKKLIFGVSTTLLFLAQSSFAYEANQYTIAAQSAVFFHLTDVSTINHNSAVTRKTLKALKKIASLPPSIANSNLINVKLDTLERNIKDQFTGVPDWLIDEVVPSIHRAIQDAKTAAGTPADSNFKPDYSIVLNVINDSDNHLLNVKESVKP